MKQSQDLEQSPITGDFSSLLIAGSNEQYGSQDNVRIFEVKEAGEDVYEKVVDFVMKMRHQISKTDISICLRVPCRNLKKDEGRPQKVG